MIGLSNLEYTPAKTVFRTAAGLNTNGSQLATD